jgi:hypothetical protein
MNFNLIPYKNINSQKIKKYHIEYTKDFILKEVSAPFGREFYNEKFTGSKNLGSCNLGSGDARSGDAAISSKQQRLNIDPIKLETSKIISDIEDFFKDIDELKELNLISNIIDREKNNKIIRFHLKTNNGITTTTFNKEWLDFDKYSLIDIKFHPDCLWIDEASNKYGVSLVITSVYQK